MPVSQELSIAVALCGTISRLVQVIVSPGFTERLSGINRNSLISMKCIFRSVVDSLPPPILGTKRVMAATAAKALRRLDLFFMMTRIGSLYLLNNHYRVIFVRFEYFQAGLKQGFDFRILDIGDEGVLDQIIYCPMIFQFVLTVSSVEGFTA